MSTHPKVPFQAEEAAEFTTLIEQMSEGIVQPVNATARFHAIKKKYRQRRDREHPGWLDRYERDVMEWIKLQRPAFKLEPSLGGTQF